MLPGILPNFYLPSSFFSTKPLSTFAIARCGWCTFLCRPKEWNRPSCSSSKASYADSHAKRQQNITKLQHTHFCVYHYGECNFYLFYQLCYNLVLLTHRLSCTHPEEFALIVLISCKWMICKYMCRDMFIADHFDLVVYANTCTYEELWPVFPCDILYSGFALMWPFVVDRVSNIKTQWNQAELDGIYCPMD